MEYTIDNRYSTYSTSIIFYLLHNNEDYKNLWVDKFPETENQANNFFKNVNCGCRPVLLNLYKKLRFEVDLLTVNFIKENPTCIDFDKFCKEVGGQNLRGSVFSIPKTESDFKDFMAALQEKKADFNAFNTVEFEDKILISFF